MAVASALSTHLRRRHATSSADPNTSAYPSAPRSIQNLAAPCTPCRYVVTQKHIGDTMRLKVLRGGKVQELEVRQACCGRSAHPTAAVPSAASSTAQMEPREQAHYIQALPAAVHPPCQITLSAYQYLVPPHLRESKPSYFIVGGLVFTSCSGEARRQLC